MGTDPLYFTLNQHDAKIRVAYEDGVKQVILPADNITNTEDIPQYVKDALVLYPVTGLDQVIACALAVPATGAGNG